jgi:hypothetical protein
MPCATMPVRVRIMQVAVPFPPAGDTVAAHPHARTCIIHRLGLLRTKIRKLFPAKFFAGNLHSLDAGQARSKEAGHHADRGAGGVSGGSGARTSGPYPVLFTLKMIRLLMQDLRNGVFIPAPEGRVWPGAPGAPFQSQTGRRGAPGAPFQSQTVALVATLPEGRGRKMRKSCNGFTCHFKLGFTDI